MPTTPPSPTLFELETDLYTPSPTTPKGSLSPLSSSCSPHQTILRDKYNKGIITLEEHDELLQARQQWHAENLKQTATAQPPHPPTMPSEEDQRQVQKWRNRRIREESRATYKALESMPIIQKGIEERAPLNRIRQGMLRLARGTRKHIRPKRRRSTRRRSTRRRTKRRRTNRRRTKRRR